MIDTEPSFQPARPPVAGAIVLGLALLALDAFLKMLADTRLPLDQVVATPLPFLVWRLTYNTGSHYLFGSVGQWVPYRMVMGIAAVAVVALVTMMAWDVHRASRSRLRTAQWWLVAVLIGALGNALEVLTRGRATDYFMLRPFPWPANLCDQYVNAAMFVLLPLTLWFGWRQGGSSTDPDPGSANA